MIESKIESKYNIDLIYDKAVAIVKRHKNDLYPNWDIIEKELAAEASKPLTLAKEILAHEGFTDLFLSQPHSLEAMQKHTRDVVTAHIAAATPAVLTTLQPQVIGAHVPPQQVWPGAASIDATIAAQAAAALPVVAPKVESSTPQITGASMTPDLMQEDDEPPRPRSRAELARSIKQTLEAEAANGDGTIRVPEGMSWEQINKDAAEPPENEKKFF